MQVWSKSIHLFRRYRVGKPNLISFHGLVTLKMRSRSPKSNQLFPPSQPCIFASLVKIHLLVQKISRRKEATRTPTRTQTRSAPKTICPPNRICSHLRLGGHNDKQSNIAKHSIIYYTQITTVCHLASQRMVQMDRRNYPLVSTSCIVERLSENF